MSAGVCICNDTDNCLVQYDLSAFVGDANDLFYISWQKETVKKGKI